MRMRVNLTLFAVCIMILLGNAMAQEVAYLTHANQRIYRSNDLAFLAPQGIQVMNISESHDRVEVDFMAEGTPIADMYSFFEQQLLKNGWQPSWNRPIMASQRIVNLDSGILGEYHQGRRSIRLEVGHAFSHYYVLAYMY